MSATRRLYLLRHAQASPSGPSDYRRPLDGQGERDARMLGEILHARGLRLADAIVSSAARTRATWQCLSSAGVAVAAIEYEDALYDGGLDAYRAAALRSPCSDRLVIGHNPTIAAFAMEVVTDGERLALETLQRGFPTCALAIVRLEDDRGLEGGFLEEMLLPPHRLR